MVSDSEEEDTVVKIGNVLQEIDEENWITMGGVEDRSACTFIRVTNNSCSLQYIGICKTTGALHLSDMFKRRRSKSCDLFSLCD